MSPAYGGYQGISKIALDTKGNPTILTFQVYEVDKRKKPVTKDIAVIKL